MPHDNAGLIIVRAGKPAIGVETSFAGFAIEIHFSKSSEWMNAFIAMRDAFAASDIPTITNIPTNETANATAMHFIVGSKQ